MPLKERTTVDLREQMVLKALERRLTVTQVAEMFGVTRPTVRLWRDRYRQFGRAALEERSHAPHRQPHRTSVELEELIVAERLRWGWGSKKILSRLSEAHPALTLPKRPTVDAILDRRGLVSHRPRGRSRSRTPFIRRYQASEPSELTTIDSKGTFA